MRLGERSPQAILIGGYQDHVNVVGHQAIGPDLRPGTLSHFNDQLAVGLVVSIVEERPFLTVAALSDEMGQSGNDDAGQTRHEMPEWLFAEV